jgi:hypothetical protein
MSILLKMATCVRKGDRGSAIETYENVVIMLRRASF